MLQYLSMNNKRFTIIISTVALIVAILAFFIAWQNKQPAISELPWSVVENSPNTATTTPVIISNKTEREIYKNTDEKSIYVNQKYGIQFTYPQTWRVVDNILGRGIFQLFNYSEFGASGSVFAVGTNKIEAVVGTNDMYGSSDDYPEKTRMVTEIEVVGQKTIRTEIELIGGEKILHYAVSLPKHSGKFFSVAIYGDPLNFYILDELIASIEWI